MSACTSVVTAVRWVTAAAWLSCLSTVKLFKFHVPAGTDFEELELSMIDLGVDEFAPEERNDRYGRGAL